MIQSSNKLIVKDPFEMPAVDDTTVLVLRECVDLVPHCWIWNESVGYLEVVTYSGYDIYVTVKNVGMKENATSGTIFPSCMEFLITAPNATPIIDNTVTCLRADFKCPTVGQEALMSVDSTSAIRVGDIIIVDTRYQYLVTEIINEHTMKVLNEEKGKEGGVIDVKCNECVPVKILESTHCCEALQDQVDDIYSRIDTKKSVVSNNVLLSVDHGIDAISDVSYDIELDIDTDLSKYDNSVSKFTSLRYFKETTSGVDAIFNPDRSTGYTNYDLGTNTNYFNNAYINKIQGGQGRSSFISLPIDGSDTMYSNGTMFSYNAHAFYSGGKKLVAFAHDQAEFSTKILPTSTSTYDLGGSTSTWNNIYTDSITLNGTTYTSIPTVNDATLTIYNSDGITPFVTFTANASSNVSATLPASGNTYTASSPLSIDALNDISISQATTSTDGYLSSTDWNTFNNKAEELEHFEESLSGTTASFQPKTSSSASTYDLGSSSDNYDNSFVNYSYCAELINIITNIDYIQFSTLSTSAHPINYVAGTTSGNYGKHAFYTGGRETLEIDYERVNSNGRFYVQDNGVDHLSIGYTSMVPENNTNYSIGNNTTPFSSSYITNTYTNNIYNQSGTTIYLQTNMRDSGPGAHNLGSNDNYFSGVYAGGFITRPSDIREKENIENYKNSVLDKLNKLNPMTYTIKGSKDGEVKFGLSAQELQEIEPLCVVGSETKSDEKLGIELYATLTLAMQAIKELSAKVKDLESKLGEKDADSKVLEK